MLKKLVHGLKQHAPRELARLLPSGIIGASYTKKREIVSRVRPQNLLVLSPHPDDEIIGMGGLLQLHMEAGSRITIAYITDGGMLGNHQQNAAKQRLAEAEALGRQYGFTQHFWLYSDGRLRASEEAIARLAALIDATQPEVIALPSFFDQHFDHFATNHILVAALERTRAQLRILGFEVSNAIPLANHIADISPVFSGKMRMLDYYALALADCNYTTICTHRAALHYAQAIDSHAAGYAEAFLAASAHEYSTLYRQVHEALRSGGSALVTPTLP